MLKDGFATLEVALEVPYLIGHRSGILLPCMQGQNTVSTWEETWHLFPLFHPS